ncbi:MAG: hypothetical protein JWN87_3390 [Frankiales bacterium]|nr:hypothetical protein [Frankiales bacterium]
MAVKDQNGVDYRSERMPSAEGRGEAKSAFKRAWDGYSRAVTSVGEPLIRPVAEKLAAPVTLDLLGFWLAWHLEGGFEGLQRIGMSRASIYRRVSLFRKTMGVHPDEFRFPGVELDLDAYLRNEGPTIAPRATHPKMKSQTTDK